jgi:hypothetical protein
LLLPVYGTGPGIDCGGWKGGRVVSLGVTSGHQSREQTDLESKHESISFKNGSSKFKTSFLSYFDGLKS